jgi:hypothetical protein
MRSLSILLPALLPDDAAVALVSDGLAKWREKYGWDLVHEGTLTRTDTVRIDSWTERDETDLRIDLVRDDGLGLMWLSAVHGDDARRTVLFDRIADTFAHVDADQSIEAARRPDSTKSALVAAALASNQAYDERLFSMIVAALRSEDVEVRANAAIAASLLLWETLSAPLQASGESETDEGVKRMMEAVVSLIESSSAGDR